jgi:hypothetical protein
MYIVLRENKKVGPYERRNQDFSPGFLCVLYRRFPSPRIYLFEV